MSGNGAGRLLAAAGMAGELVVESAVILASASHVAC